MPIFTLLYVESVARSVAFYRALLGIEPLEEHPCTFASFPLSEGAFLGIQGSDHPMGLIDDSNHLLIQLVVGE